MWNNLRRGERSGWSGKRWCRAARMANRLVEPERSSAWVAFDWPAELSPYRAAPRSAREASIAPSIRLGSGQDSKGQVTAYTQRLSSTIASGKTSSLSYCPIQCFSCATRRFARGLLQKVHANLCGTVHRHAT